MSKTNKLSIGDTTYIAVKEAELVTPVTGHVYCLVNAGGLQGERTANLNGENPILMFNELLTITLETTKLKVGIYKLSNGFTDTLLGECIVDIHNQLTNGRYELTCYNSKESLTEVVGSIYITIENIEYNKGKTFRQAKSFLQQASSDDLEAFNIAQNTSSKSVTKIIREVLKENNTEVDLSGIKLTKCPPEMTQIAITTKSLDMGFNLFTIYPDVSFLGFQYLQEFTLTGNQIEELPPTIGQLCNLTAFYINGNKLHSLPSEIGQLTLLEKLDLSNNQLTSLLPEIGYLTNLQDLLLSGNPIHQLPRSLGRCINMEVIDMSSCELESIPNEFTRMTCLMELNLGNNNLKALPSNIGRMSRLVSLNLADNQLNDLPLSIGYCQGIIQCYLDRNPIQDKKIIQTSKMGADHLCDYLETRMLSYMADKGINPQKMQEQMERSQREEIEAKERAILLKKQQEEEENERLRLQEEQRVQEAIEAHKKEMLAQSSPQEQAIVAKLNQAKNMGTVIYTDCLNRIANLEMFVSQVNSIRAGLPFSRAVDALTVDLEAIQRVIGYQREPAVPRVGVGFASPQLQNFKHGMLIKLAHITVCIQAAVPFLQQCDDAQNIVNLVKIARAMNFKLTNIV